MDKEIIFKRLVLAISILMLALFIGAAVNEIMNGGPLEEDSVPAVATADLVSLVLLLVLLASLKLLHAFKPLGRQLFIALTVGGFALNFMYPLEQHHPNNFFELVVSQAILMLEGMILAMMYLTDDISRRFEG